MRYAAGSVVAFGCSEVVLMAAYGLLGTRAWTAASLAWVAGAVPNYILNRRWAWKRRGRAQFLRETLPYWVITLSTAAMAVGVTSLVDNWVRSSVNGRGEQSLLLGAVYLAAYGVVFAVKFVLFDKWVFAGRGGADRGGDGDRSRADQGGAESASQAAPDPAQSLVEPMLAPSAVSLAAPSTVAPSSKAPSATGR
jgi:putative flippase GtrA